MSAQRPSGERWLRLVRWILNQPGGRICWLCGHPGADTADHVIPLEQRPDLAWDIRNLKPAHGERRTIAQHGFECIGNYARGNAPAPTNATHSRKW